MPLTPGKDSVLQSLRPTIQMLVSEFDQIPQLRKPLLSELTEFISQQLDRNAEVRLNFICTHNSRRSHISQIWAQTAAAFYGIRNVRCYSGGTEATAFNPRAVKAMKNAGFDILVSKEGDNPVYLVRYAEQALPITVFSKKFDDDFNPKRDFAAIMTCSHADENCPFVAGAIKRIALTYDDPKDFDGTALESQKYTERVNEIGREILYAFSQVR